MIKYKFTIFTSLVISVIFAISALPVYAQSGQITFTPIRIPFESQEIINPLRGYSKWNDQERITSQVMPHMDAYKRYNWKDLETSQGNYDFSIIENDIVAASNSGQKFRFGVRALRGVDDSYYAGMHVPQYLEPYGWWLTNGGNRYFIPDWNHDFFLDRAEALLMALGERYNNDARVSAINIRMYGLYGEWHMAGVNYSLAPTQSAAYCGQSICVNNKPIKPGNSNGAASLRRIVDMHARAFPTKQLIMMVGQSDSSENVSDAVMYAMSKTANSVPPVSKPIGWRNECLGYVWYNSLGRYYEHFRDTSTFTQWSNNTYTNNSAESLMKNRWMYAPVDTEYCPISSSMINGTGSDVFLKAQQQIIDYHVSMLGNGNMDPPPQARLQEAINAGKQAGYRIALKSLRIPNPLPTSQNFIVNSEWENFGVAPVYESWNVYFQLRSGNNIVWSAKSSINLKNILPTSTTAVSQTDNFNLSQIAAGSYSLTLKICDPVYTSCNTNQTPPTTGMIRKPLALAIEGKNSDGSYNLGNVTVGNSGSVTPTGIPADANADGKIDGIDYQIWLNHYNQNVSGTPNGDFNNSGRVDIADLIIWISNY